MSRVRTASGLKTIVGVSVRTGSGLLDGVAAFIRTASGLKSWWGTLSVTIAPLGAGGATASSFITTVNSNAVTASPAGGSPPYSYSWAEVTGSGQVSANSPASASTSFGALVDPHDEVAATWACTVTDSAGQTAESAPIPITLNNYGRYGGP